MTRIYKITEARTPKIIRQYFYRNFPSVLGYTYQFYWYGENIPPHKYYGCNVFKDGEFYHNATQGTVATFMEMNKIPY